MLIEDDLPDVYGALEFTKRNIVQELKIFVPGVPIPKGSKIGGITHKYGKPRAFVYDQQSDKLKQWEKTIAGITRIRLPSDWQTNGCFMVNIIFLMKRPALHFNSKGEIKEEYYQAIYHSSKPDSDKLQRAVFDGLTNVAFDDDSNVVFGIFGKFYATKTNPGALVSVVRLRDRGNP